MKKLRLILIAGFLLASPAWAAGDQDTMKLAEQLVSLQMDDAMKNKGPDAMVLMISPLVVRDNPGQDQQIAQIMQKDFKPVLIAGADEIMHKNAEFYAQNFTADELQQLITFNSSTVAQKFKKFNLDNTAKARDEAKAINTAKMAEAVRVLVAQLKLNNLHAPKELDH